MTTTLELTISAFSLSGRLEEISSTIFSEFNIEEIAEDIILNTNPQLLDFRSKVKGNCVFIFQGIPSVGKSSVAKYFASSLQKYDFKRVNKDDLRSMIDGGAWSKKNEEQIIAARNVLLKNFLSHGHDVIIDDTNYHIPHIKKILEVAGNVADVFVIDFHQNPKDCIFWDYLRENSVGADVIRKIAGQRESFLKKIEGHTFPIRDNRVPTFNPDLPPAIIVDIDGTVAHMQGRSPYDFSRVDEDRVDPHIRDLVNHMYFTQSWGYGERVTVLIFSGRDDSCYDTTAKWLKDNGVMYDKLMMRASDDNRPDYIVKKEMYFEHVEGKFDVQFVLDDRNSVVSEWRSMGLKALQVEDGDF